MKKMNLMPSEIRAQELVKLIRKSAFLLALIPVLYIGYLFLGNYMIEKDIAEVQERIDEVDAIRRSVDNMEVTIEQKKEFLSSLDRSEFELNGFVEFLNFQVPDDLNIISVDSTDRLNEREEEVVVQSVVELDDEGNPIEKEPEEKPKPKEEPFQLILRGHSSNSTSIADLIYKITLLGFVEDVQLSAIEEKFTSEGYENVFEIIIDIN